MNNQINREIHKVKNKTGFRINPELSEELKFWWIDSSIIDKELYKKDLEVIQLFFDKSKTWLTIKATAFAWSLVLLINTWDNIYLRIIFIISLIFWLIWLVSANRTYNITFNTLLKKLEESKK